MVGHWNRTSLNKFCINLDHDHFQHKTVIYFVPNIGNIYTIAPFCKHALRVFHTAAWLILLAHAQTNIPPVQQQQMQQFSAMQNNMMALIEQQRQQSEMILELFKMTNNN